MLQPQITAVKPLSDYRLLLDFATGEQKIFNVSPYLHGDWYGKLRDANFFQTVHIEGNTVAWAGGQDIAPHELYNDSISIENSIHRQQRWRGKKCRLYFSELQALTLNAVRR